MHSQYTERYVFLAILLVVATWVMYKGLARDLGPLPISPTPTPAPFVNGILQSNDPYPTLTPAPTDTPLIFPDQLTPFIPTLTPRTAPTLFVAAPTAVPTEPPKATPIPLTSTPTAFVQRTYWERRADGNLYHVEQWSDGRFTTIGEMTATPAPPTLTPIPPTPTVIPPTATPTLVRSNTLIDFFDFHAYTFGGPGATAQVHTGDIITGTFYPYAYPWTLVFEYTAPPVTYASTWTIIGTHTFPPGVTTPYSWTYRIPQAETYRFRVAPTLDHWWHYAVYSVFVMRPNWGP